MSNKQLHIIYNSNHPPYLYGSICVKGSCDPCYKWGNPFVISKNGQVYGSIRRLTDKTLGYIKKLEDFHRKSQAELRSKGVTGLPDGTLPDSPIKNRILDAQEGVIEESLVLISANIRNLAEFFRREVEACKISIYDYDNKPISERNLNEISNIVLHNRYLAVVDKYINDLFSDKKFLGDSPKTGYKIDFLEYIQRSEELIYRLTVKDLIASLRGFTERLTHESTVREIIFLHNNLYTLGGFVMPGGDFGESVIKSIVEKVLDRMFPDKSVEVRSEVIYSEPTFSLGNDLCHKQICVTMTVNGSKETLAVDYKEFFEDIEKSFGHINLYHKGSG